MNTSNMVKQAVQMQAANMVQKSILDSVSTKIVRIKQIVDGSIRSTAATPYSRMTKGELTDLVNRHDIEISKIADTLSLTRTETQELRPEVLFDDEEVQAALTEAVERITKRILEM